jgi:ATP-dependent Lhr-like helicase
MTDVGRLARLLDRAQGTMLHVELDRVSPMAVPVLVIVGRERTATGTSDDQLLIEAEGLAAIAMRRD